MRGGLRCTNSAGKYFDNTSGREKVASIFQLG